MSEKVVDLDWEWIKSLHGQSIGELRISDCIGGCDNLRIIFYRGDESVAEPLPIIWILHVMQKKSNDFSTNNIKVFKARKQMVMEYFYRRGTRTGRR